LWSVGADAGADSGGATAAADQSLGEALSSPRELRRNRLDYVIGQTIYSNYVYSIAAPTALDISSEKVVAIQLLSVPIAFGSHYYLSRDKEFHDAHVWSANYFAGNSLFLSYTVPLVILGFDDNSYRTGSFVAMGAYPLSLWMAYRHGEQFKDNPGRVNLQSSMALSGLLMGYLFIPVWASFDGGEGTGRLVMAQLVASGVAGHYASYLYRPDDVVPGGVGTGIWTHTVLGFMGGLTLLTFAETGDVRAASGILLAGTAVGFGEGLNFFRNRHDSYEKARYDAMGALGGALVPLGLAILF
jgi:hypothetical protein